jgi:hypothetical protein
MSNLKETAYGMTGDSRRLSLGIFCFAELSFFYFIKCAYWNIKLIY